MNHARVYITDSNASSHVTCSAPKSEYESLEMELASSPEVRYVIGYRRNTADRRGYHRLLLLLDGVQSVAAVMVRVNGLLHRTGDSGQPFIFYVVRVRGMYSCLVVDMPT